MVNEQDHINLGLACAYICKVLGRGTGEKKLNVLSKFVCDAINQLTTEVQPTMPHRPSVRLSCSCYDLCRNTEEGHQTRQEAQIP